jgi:hypothetical protein
MYVCVGRNFGDDCLPQSSMMIDYPVTREINTEGGANATPGWVEVSILGDER